jgi:hypothetical protein
MDRFGRGEAAGSIPADAGFGQTIYRQGSNVRAADNELHDALAAATCVKELSFVAISLFGSEDLRDAQSRHLSKAPEMCRSSGRHGCF